jgi:hypothetical protein
MEVWRKNVLVSVAEQVKSMETIWSTQDRAQHYCFYVYSSCPVNLLGYTRAKRATENCWIFCFEDAILITL